MIQIADWKISKEIFRNEPIAGKKEIFFFLRKERRRNERKEEKAAERKRGRKETV